MKNMTYITNKITHVEEMIASIKLGSVAIPRDGNPLCASAAFQERRLITLRKALLQSEPEILNRIAELKSLRGYEALVHRELLEYAVNIR